MLHDETNFGIGTLGIGPLDVKSCRRRMCGRSASSSSLQPGMACALLLLGDEPGTRAGEFGRSRANVATRMMAAAASGALARLCAGRLGTRWERKRWTAGRF